MGRTQDIQKLHTLQVEAEIARFEHLQGMRFDVEGRMFEAADYEKEMKHVWEDEVRMGLRRREQALRGGESSFYDYETGLPSQQSKSATLKKGRPWTSMTRQDTVHMRDMHVTDHIGMPTGVKEPYYNSFHPDRVFEDIATSKRERLEREFRSRSVRNAREQAYATQKRSQRVKDYDQRRRTAHHKLTQQRFEKSAHSLALGEHHTVSRFTPLEEGSQLQGSGHGRRPIPLYNTNDENSLMNIMMDSLVFTDTARKNATGHALVQPKSRNGDEENQELFTHDEIRGMMCDLDHFDGKMRSKTGKNKY